MDIENCDTSLNDLVEKWKLGDLEARDQLINIIHKEVEKIASIILRRNKAPLSLITSELANEAFLKLLQNESIPINSHAHLMALCARIMRFLIVDKTRQRLSQKNNAPLVTLSTEYGAEADSDVIAIELDNLLNRLNDMNPERAKIVEMRYFGGMTYEEIAMVMEVSPSTVKRSWQATRGWLKDALENAA